MSRIRVSPRAMHVLCRLNVVWPIYSCRLNAVTPGTSSETLARSTTILCHPRTGPLSRLWREETYKEIWLWLAALCLQKSSNLSYLLDVRLDTFSNILSGVWIKSSELYSRIAVAKVVSQWPIHNIYALLSTWSDDSYVAAKKKRKILLDGTPMFFKFLADCSYLFKYSIEIKVLIMSFRSSCEVALWRQARVESRQFGGLVVAQISYKTFKSSSYALIYLGWVCDWRMENIHVKITSAVGESYKN